MASGDLAGVNLLAGLILIRRREVFHRMEREFRLEVINDVQASVPQLASRLRCRGPAWGLLAPAGKLRGGGSRRGRWGWVQLSPTGTWASARPLLLQEGLSRRGGRSGQGLHAGLRGLRLEAGGLGGQWGWGFAAVVSAWHRGRWHQGPRGAGGVKGEWWWRGRRGRGGRLPGILGGAGSIRIEPWVPTGWEERERGWGGR